MADEQSTIEQSLDKKTLYQRIKAYRQAECVQFDDTEENTITNNDIVKQNVKSKKRKKTAEPMSIERYYAEFTPDKLRLIDPWSPNKYLDYYSKVLPALRSFTNQSEGYKPVAIENNLPFLISTNQIARDCVKCTIYNQPHKRYLVPVGTNKLPMWWCEHDQYLEGGGTFNRYKQYGAVLWTLEDLIQRPNLVQTMRSLYYHNVIRYNDNKLYFWTKRWDEIAAFNAVIDIDVTYKHTSDMYKIDDKVDQPRYNVSFDMLSKIVDKLKEHDTQVKIHSSGNGWQLITQKISIATDNIPKYETIYVDKPIEIVTENDDGTTETKIVSIHTQFWNKVMQSIVDIQDAIIRPIVEKYDKYFELDAKKPYANKLYKCPGSLHQRLDYIAKPTNLDEINSHTAKEFQTLVDPQPVIDSNKPYDLFKPWR